MKNNKGTKRAIVIILILVLVLIIILAIHAAQKHSEQDKAELSTTRSRSIQQTEPELRENRFTDLKAGYNMPYAVTVNTAQEIVTVYQKDRRTGEYTVPVKAFVCSTGLHRGNTPEKTYYMPDDCRRPEWWSLNGGNGYEHLYGKVATRISPQSEHILFHSVPYTKAGDSSSLEPGEYNKLGSPASQGCVRMRLCDVKWIYKHLDPGTCVKIYYATKVHEPMRPEKAQKVTNNPNSKYFGWDPTDSDPNNPYHS